MKFNEGRIIGFIIAVCMISMIIVGFSTFVVTVGRSLINMSRDDTSSGNSYLPTPMLPGVSTRAFPVPLPWDQVGVEVTNIRTVPLRVLNILITDGENGVANVETPDGNTYLLSLDAVRGLDKMKPGQYFRFVSLKDYDTGELFVRAEEIPEFAIDFTTGLFSEGTSYRRELDESQNIGP